MHIVCVPSWLEARDEGGEYCMQAISSNESGEIDCVLIFLPDDIHGFNGVIWPEVSNIVVSAWYP